MRILSINIVKWRAFENVEFSVPRTNPIVCIVGANGSGKSQLLELIGACATQIGLASGYESNRPSPFGEEAEFAVSFYIEPGLIPEVEDPTGYPTGAWTSWDRTLTLRYSKQTSVVIQAGKLDSGVEEFANVIVSKIHQRKSVHYLTLDADRSYPKISIQPHELPSVYITDWEASTRANSFRSTKNLYEEWYRFFVGAENQSNNLFAQKVRSARENGIDDPRFVDIFEKYRKSLREILPALNFKGIDPNTRSVIFSVNGKELSFDQLSGGEREIAFIVGQIDRFALKKGLLLIDEPELHLNPDLLRMWVTSLRNSVEAGQIWMATHSQEVAEVCGQSSSFLIEKDENQRGFKIAPISSSPLNAVLSRALGSPAFSISKLKFILVEGEEELGERERFRMMTACGADVRFIEAGSCRDVQRKLQMFQQISDSAAQHIDARGVVDRDWRNTVECELLEKLGLHVLSVHEIENFFLDPETVGTYLKNTGREQEEYFPLLQKVADKRAGAWIFDSTRTKKDFEDFPPPSKEAREIAYNSTWEDFNDISTRCASIVDKEAHLKEEQRKKLLSHLIVQAKIYLRLRSDQTNLWQRCEGKEVFGALLYELGFSNFETAQRALAYIWASKKVWPDGLEKLRAFLEKGRFTHPSSTPR